MSDVDPGSQSLIVVLCYANGSRYFCSIAQLKTLADSEPWTPEQIQSPRVFHTKYIAHFKEPRNLPSCTWLFCPPSSTSNDLYMLPDNYAIDSPQMHGAKFNCSTNELQSIKPPNAPKFGGHVAPVGSDIYFKANPCNYRLIPNRHGFERYNPNKDEWDNKLKPFPLDAPVLNTPCIVATAVWENTILFNIVGYQFWAYHVLKHKWYPVFIPDGDKNSHKNSRCYAFLGQGIVVNNIIYGSSDRFSTVLALSILQSKHDNGDIEYSCSLLSEILVPYRTRVWHELALNHTSHFLHLGNDNFCLVQSCKFETDLEYQTIHVTNLRLMGKDKLDVMSVCIHRLRILKGPYGQFHIGLCFSQPEGKTTALKQHETTFLFNRCTGFVSKQEDDIDFNPEPEAGKPIQEVENVTLPVGGPSEELKAAFLGYIYENSNTDREGHSIIVVNLPHDATAKQLEMGLMKFGRLKRNMIRLKRDTRENFCYAIVEFESATSMRRAIEASPVRIGGCSAYILEKLTKVDSNRKSGSSTYSQASTIRSGVCPADKLEKRKTPLAKQVDRNRKTGSSTCSQEIGGW